MMRRFATAILPLLLVLAGCGDDGDAPERNVTKIVVAKGNPYHQRLLALSDTNRKLALRRAVQDDGGDCRTIRDSAYQQDHEGMAMWIARCGGGDWAVFVAPSGFVQVRACKDAAELGLPECRGTTLDPATGPVWPEDANPRPPAITR
jgi:hypothetical protein